jgi:hypothetical protein
MVLLSDDKGVFLVAWRFTIHCLLIAISRVRV